VADTLSPRAKLTADSRLILVRVKIERAKQHLVGLERELTAHSAYAHVILTEENAQTGFHEQREFRRLRAIPFNSVATAGDIIQNLRSSLDHLANQLILVAGNEPTRASCFPISENVATYEREKARKVKGMRSEAIEAIDALKPYGGGNEFLWRLHELNNIDKHRLLFTVDRDTIFQAAWINHPLGSQFNTFGMKASQPHFGGIFDRKMENQIQLEIGKTLEESKIAEGDALLPSLHQLVNAVENLILGFKPLLQ
jgi:hypothetical protein